ncbi:MAG: XrtX-associated membrane protein [Bacteroidia bacterium]
MTKGRKSIKFFIYATLLLSLIILSGYFRDYIFKSINALLRAWDNDQDYFLPAPLSFLENYDYDTLVNLKWLLTLLFSLFYFLLSVWALRLLFGDHRYRKLCLLTYAGIITISGIFIASGYMFTGISEKMYEFARYLMGMAQSPVLLMILIPALKLSEKEKAQRRNS